MQKLVAEIMEIDAAQIHPESRLREDLGMDSLGSLELLSSIGDDLGIHLDIDDAMDIVTFHDACTFVERSMESRETTSLPAEASAVVKH